MTTPSTGIDSSNLDTFKQTVFDNAPLETYDDSSPPPQPPGSIYASPQPQPEKIVYDPFEQDDYKYPENPGGYGMPKTKLQSDPGIIAINENGEEKVDIEYKNVVPLSTIGRGPAPVDCPACGARGLTVSTPVTGNTTHAWALGVRAFTLLGPLLYLTDALKDLDHRCGKCGLLLATWHRSGRTVVHLRPDV